MTEKKSGTIKPPIIDLEANKAKNTKKLKQKIQKKPANFQLSSIVLGSLGGAILGVGAVFLLAQSGFWPQNNKQIAPISQISEQNSQNSIAIKNLNQKLIDFEGLNSNLNKQISELKSQNNNITNNLNTINERLDTKKNTQSQIFSDLKKEVSNLKTNLAKNLEQTNQFDSVNLSKINNQLKLLDERLTAISLGDINEETKDFTSLFTPLKQDTLKLTDQINAINNNIGLQKAQINTLEKNIDALTQKFITLETANTTPTPPIIQQTNTQLPLIISKFESAISNGKSFKSILIELKIIVPDIKISKEINKLSIDGLDNPQIIIDEFSAKIPNILSASPKIEGASWQESLTDKAKSLIALRPTKEIDGNNPSAIVAQIEKALEKQDFIKANDLINSLPTPMQEAVGDVGKKINSFANVQSFIQNIKNKSINESVN